MLWSRILFLAAFSTYLGASLGYLVHLTGACLRRLPRLSDAGRWLVAAGVALHGLAILLRWVASGQAPFSNLFEYMSFMAWSVMAAFLLIDRRYRVPALGAFVAPLGVIIIAYASVFPQEVQPLVPALQSYWLWLHVSFAALGEGAFAVGFGAGLMYLLRTLEPHPGRRAERILLEGIFVAAAALAGFLALALAFRAAGWQQMVPGTGLVYGLPALIGPRGIPAGVLGQWVGLPLPLAAAPSWMTAVAGKHLNSLVWALLAGGILYLALRILMRRPLREVCRRWLAGADPVLLDDVSYRAIAIGFPVFTLGALVFAMIWAEKAWGSYWSWDPKETWALVSWLLYAGYLHLRVVKGWQGRPAAWVAVAGFMVILFTLVGVNLLISGLHSYAG